MTQAWQPAGGQCRRWTGIPATLWCYSPSGNLVHAHGPGGALDLVPSSAIVAKAKHSIASYGALIAYVVRAREQDPAAQDFYTRALLAIGQHETGFGPLPAYGDCLSEGGGVVPCNSPAATGAPQAAGWFQIERSTMQGIGLDWHELATSMKANVVDALTLALDLEPHHAMDFPTLVAYWAAGGVYPDASNTWGARASNRATYTQFAQIWNAIGDVHAAGFPDPPPAMLESPSSSHPGRAAIGGVILLGTMATIALVKR